MKKKLTKEEFMELSAYDHEFLCAKSDYLRTPGRQGLKVIKKVYARLYGQEFDGSDTCGSCELRLLQSVMDSYFYTKELNKKK